MSNFYTDVISKSPQFYSPQRIDDLNLLEPSVRTAVLTIVQGAQAQGITIRPLETYRSQIRQAQLFIQGATKLKSVGVHHYGLACDFVKMVAGEPTWRGDWTFLGDLAKQNGLVWGGDWGTAGPHSFVDMDHIQACTLDQQAALFAGSWYPS